jgi:hypothetical protein
MLPYYASRISPSEELQDTIKCFWYNRSEHELELSSFEVLPDGYAEIIFYFGSYMMQSLSPYRLLLW